MHLFFVIMTGAILLFQQLKSLVRLLHNTDNLDGEEQ